MTPAIESTVGLVPRRSVRTFCYGYLGILIPPPRGSRPRRARDRVAVTLTLGASALLTLLARRPAERLSRAVLVALAAPVLVAGVLLATGAGRPSSSWQP
jgi:hypothetical protein